MANQRFGADQEPERQQKTEGIERRKRDNFGPGQAPENTSRTRDLEQWKHKTAQRDEDKGKTDRIEKLKRKP